jgi:hypothetical protein
LLDGSPPVEPQPLAADREVIEKVLADYAAVPYAHGDVVTQTVFDRASDHYLLMILGSDN